MPRLRTVKIGDVARVVWTDPTEQSGWRKKGETIEPIIVESFGKVTKLPTEDDPMLEIIGDEQINGDCDSRVQVKDVNLIKEIQVVGKWVQAKIE